MADRARFDLFNDRRLIPPGIRDARSEAVLAAFAHGAALMDFRKLLMRRGDEIPDEALPFAIHERSLGEYIPAYGLPAGMVRDLVDGSFDIHARQATEGGMAFGIELIGMTLHLARWYELTPPGPHDTYQAKVFLSGDAYGSAQVPADAMIAAAADMLDATRRWSQDMAVLFGVRATVSGPIGCVACHGGRHVAGMAGAAPTPRPQIVTIIVPRTAGRAVAGLEAA